MRLSCEVAGARADKCEPVRFMQKQWRSSCTLNKWMNEWQRWKEWRCTDCGAHTIRLLALDIPFLETNGNDKICMRKHTGHSVVRGGIVLRWNRWEKSSCYCVSVLAVCQCMHMHKHSHLIPNVFWLRFTVVQCRGSIEWIMWWFWVTSRPENNVQLVSAQRTCESETRKNK